MKTPAVGTKGTAWIATIDGPVPMKYECRNFQGEAMACAIGKSASRLGGCWSFFNLHATYGSACRRSDAIRSRARRQLRTKISVARKALGELEVQMDKLKRPFRSYK